MHDGYAENSVRFRGLVTGLGGQRSSCPQRVMGISGIRVFEDVERSAFPDAAWTDNELRRNKEPFRTKHALLLRSVFMPYTCICAR